MSQAPYRDQQSGHTGQSWTRTPRKRQPVSSRERTQEKAAQSRPAPLPPILNAREWRSNNRPQQSWRSRSRPKRTNTTVTRDRNRSRSRDLRPRRRSGSRDQHQEWNDDGDDDNDSGSSDGEATRGQFNGQPGCMILNRYEYLRDLGVGTFGKVISCYDTYRKRVCALKVVRKVSRYLNSARIEADILFQVSEAEDRYLIGHQQSRCVRLFKTFEFQGHECLVFEELGPSLLDEQKRIKYRPFDVRIIRHVSCQLLQGLQFLHERLHLVHTDVKMENVLFVERTVPDCSLRPPSALMDGFNIKLIDFGGATFTSSKNDGTINTRQYRAPEVILQLGWDFPSDIWGVGALMMEIFLGDLLFQSNEIAEHLALMERVRGHRFPETMQRESAAKRPDSYFDRRGRVIWPSDSESQANIRNARPLSEQIFTARKDLDRRMLDDFYHVVSGMLDLDPSRRLSAREALNSPFFSS